MRNEVEVALRRDRDAEGYQDALRSVLQDAATLTGAVRSLLELARADQQFGGGDSAGKVGAADSVNLTALAHARLQLEGK